MSAVVENREADYSKRAAKLDAKKQKLFTEGRLECWELLPEGAKNIPTAEELLKNKEFAFSLMLPKVALFVS